MALVRLAMKNFGQRVVVSPSCYSLVSQNFVGRSLDTAAHKQRWCSELLRGLTTASGDREKSEGRERWGSDVVKGATTASGDLEKSEGREVAVSDKDDKKFKLFPRKHRKKGIWRRHNNRNFDLLPSGLGNVLEQATENISKLLENLSPSRLMGRYKEQDECYKIRYFMPGFSKEDVKIIVEDGILRIIGEHMEEDGTESDDESWSAAMYGYYDFTFVLPEDAKTDEIKAEIKDGVLTIVIPRSEAPKKDVKKVEVQ